MHIARYVPYLSFSCCVDIDTPTNAPNTNYYARLKNKVLVKQKQTNWELISFSYIFPVSQQEYIFR